MDLHKQYTCGVPNSVFIYVIGVLHLAESVTFASLNTMISQYVDERHDVSSDLWWIDDQITSRNLALILIPLNVFRIFVALALVVGRAVNNTNSLPFFIIVTFLGIGGNLAAGIVAMNFPITYNMGLASCCVTILHAIYIIIGGKIYLQERAALRQIFLPAIQAGKTKLGGNPCTDGQWQ